MHRTDLVIAKELHRTLDEQKAMHTRRRSELKADSMNLGKQHLENYYKPFAHETHPPPRARLPSMSVNHGDRQSYMHRQQQQ